MKCQNTFLSILFATLFAAGCKTHPQSIENPEPQFNDSAIARVKAIREMPFGTCQDQLADMARSDAFGMVRYEAVRKLMNPVILAEIAESGDEPYIRAEATRKISDRAILSRLSQDSAELVRRQARQNLGQ